MKKHESPAPPKPLNAGGKRRRSVQPSSASSDDAEEDEPTTEEESPREKAASSASGRQGRRLSARQELIRRQPGKVEAALAKGHKKTQTSGESVSNADDDEEEYVASGTDEESSEYGSESDSDAAAGWANFDVKRGRRFNGTGPRVRTFISGDDEGGVRPGGARRRRSSASAALNSVVSARSKDLLGSHLLGSPLHTLQALCCPLLLISVDLFFDDRRLSCLRFGVDERSLLAVTTKVPAEPALTISSSRPLTSASMPRRLKLPREARQAPAASKPKGKTPEGKCAMT